MTPSVATPGDTHSSDATEPSIDQFSFEFTSAEVAR